MSEENLSKLEQEFKDVADKASKEIDEKLNIATKALREAQAISEKYGIPFSSNISPLGQSYIPNSLQDKWGDLDKNFMQESTETYSEYGYEGGGWEHSAVFC